MRFNVIRVRYKRLSGFTSHMITGPIDVRDTGMHACVRSVIIE